MSIWSLLKKEKAKPFSFEDMVLMSLKYWNHFNSTGTLQVNGNTLYCIVNRSYESLTVMFTYRSQQIWYGKTVSYNGNYLVRVQDTSYNNYIIELNSRYPINVIMYDKNGNKVLTDREAFNEIDFFQYLCSDAVIPCSTETMCKLKDKLLEIEHDIQINS